MDSKNEEQAVRDEDLPDAPTANLTVQIAGPVLNAPTSEKARDPRTYYHYHAFYEVGPGTLNHIDGIVGLVKPVLTMDDYRALKKLIEPDHADILVITSLTHLSGPGAAAYDFDTPAGVKL